MAQPKANVAAMESTPTRYGVLPGPLKIFCLVLWTFGIVLFIFYTSAWSIGSWVLEDTQYYYLINVVFATCVFLIMPARKKDSFRLPWYDIVLAAFVFGTTIYWTLNAKEITHIGWLPPYLPTGAFILATIMSAVAIEGGRRLAGLPYAILCLVVGLSPLIADKLPGVLWGVRFPFDYIVASFTYGRDGMLGLPAQVTGTILIGFLIFAGVLMASGAGKFFLDVALALMGRFRGGPAKVAVIASALFGTMSGATPANIVATGSFTIPAMKQLGYPPHYAAAIEAVASNGGTIMPPVMGAIAFIMAVLTNIPYATIMAAALIPAILYYWGLLVQVDGYAAKCGLKGLPKEQIPSLRKVLKGGWHYLIVIAFLVFGLIYMRWEARAPVYASGLLILLSYTNRETMVTPRKFVGILSAVGSLISYVMAVLLPLGLLMVGMQITGSLTSLTSYIAGLAGTNVMYVLLIAVAVCYLFGMVGLTMIPYIVLAVVALPGIVAATGMNIIALHFFLIFFIMTAGITPPVCVYAFIAAALAGAPPFKTGFTAMRLSVVLYFIPFFFVFEPALIMQGPAWRIIYLFILCLVGIWVLASGLEGYLLKVGRLGLWSRVLLVIGGFLIAFPEWKTAVIGSALTLAVVAVRMLRRRTALRKVVAENP